MNEFEKSLYLSSVQLVELNANKIPVEFASGALIDYKGRRILLTVSHATGNQKNWAIQQRYIPEKGTQTYALGAMHFLAKASLSGCRLKDIDFSYVEVPTSICAYRQEVSTPTSVKTEHLITVHKPSLEDVPVPTESYGFCGMVLPTHENHFGQFCVGGEIRVYSGLSFVRSEGEYDVYRLPFKHPGHDHFRGCSGSPVLSSSGAMVGLVCKGFEETDELYALSLRQQKLPIDILVGAL